MKRSVKQWYQFQFRILLQQQIVLIEFTEFNRALKRESRWSVLQRTLSVLVCVDICVQFVEKSTYTGDGGQRGVNWGERSPVLRGRLPLFKYGAVIFTNMAILRNYNKTDRFYVRENKRYRVRLNFIKRTIKTRFDSETEF